MSSTSISRLHGRPIIYGEVLFDIFPDGRKVLGGAPFNVAWHLHGFGQAPLVISRIGQDAEGQSVLDAMQDWGLDTHGIQRDAAFPTGGVEVAMQGTDHRFDIRAHQAYDFIDYQLLMESIRHQQPSLIYLGSLIIRDQTSRQTLERLLEKKDIPVFVDINLRDPWWDASSVEGLLSLARWAKLNDEELTTIVPETVRSEEGLIRAANEALRRFELDAIVVTRGAEGAFITTSDGTVSGKPLPVEHLVDTVGAGDAFCAVTLRGLHAGWSASEIIERALTFAAEICKQRGATSPNRKLYRKIYASWDLG